MPNEFNNLSKIIAEDLSQETIKVLKTDLLSQSSLIKQAYEYLLSITLTKEKPNTYLLKNSYRIIMAAREYFTGQEINYRIYYATNNKADSLNKKVGIYSLNEEDILKLVTREGNSLRLKSSFTKALNTQTRDLEREAIFDKHWSDINAGLTKLEASDIKQTVYRVHSFIYQKYIGSNPSLWNSKLKRYAGFNRGNLYEAFDATAEDAYSSSNINFIETSYQEQRMFFQDIYFGKNLKHDQVKGFQTGDVGLTQIKARHAQLMEARTLLIYLKDILEIIGEINTEISWNQNSLFNKIKKLFTDPEMTDLNPLVEEIINNRVDDLLKILQLN